MFAEFRLIEPLKPSVPPKPKPLEIGGVLLMPYPPRSTSLLIHGIREAELRSELSVVRSAGAALPQIVHERQRSRPVAGQRRSACAKSIKEMRPATSYSLPITSQRKPRFKVSLRFTFQSS